MLIFPINKNRKIVSFQILIIFLKAGVFVLKTNIFQDSIFDKENPISVKNSWERGDNKYFHFQWKGILCVNMSSNNYLNIIILTNV